MFSTNADDKFARAFAPREKAEPKPAKAAAAKTASASPAQSEPQASADGIVIIGRGTRIVGDLFDCLLLEIQGSVEGRISTLALVVREGGSVNGEVHAEDAEVHGRLDGHVEVLNTLDVRTTGYVSGEVTYGTLAVAMGGHIFGSITQLRPEPEKVTVDEPAAASVAPTLMGIEVIRPSPAHYSAN